MAENKKSVLLYCDIIHTVKSLSDEEAGKLFKHYLDYINDLNPVSDRLTELLFEPIKQNLKRDLKKWESKSLKNSDNAKKRWDANAYERIKTDANYADKVTVKVKDKVTVKDKVKDIKLEITSNVFLTDIEFEKIKVEFGVDYELALKKLSNYKNSSGKKYKSDYHALIGWVKDQIEKEKSSAKKENYGNSEKQSNMDAIRNW